MTCRLIASGRRCCEQLANSGPSTSVRATSEQTQRAMQPIVRAFRCDPQRVSIGPSKRTQPGRCSPRVRPVFRNGRRAVELRVRPVAYPNRRPPEVMQSPTCAGVHTLITQVRAARRAQPVLMLRVGERQRPRSAGRAMRRQLRRCGASSLGTAARRLAHGGRATARSSGGPRFRRPLEARHPSQTTYVPLTSIATAIARTTANAEPTTRTVWPRIHSSVWVAPVDEEPPADSMAASAGRFDPTA